MDPRHVIIGTAGHIDHGKTALVKALTGIDLDTLPDEKKRGITIELGFAFMDAPEADKQIVFIDVPGHERLIKTMVAGASNIDAVMLVVAADEGISAQTVEHFDIIELLGIERGLVVLTKSDLADADRLETLSAEVRKFLSGTRLESAQIIPASAVNGEGINEIRAALLALAELAELRPDSGVFRMPIDRVFTMRGFGTVVAGTVLSGGIKVGDKLEILPDLIPVKIRGIQVHGGSINTSDVGKRTAVNLQDIEKDRLRRGQTLCAPGSISPTKRIDARLHVQKTFGDELKNRTRIRLHTGTDEVIGRVIFLDSPSLLPGGGGLVQFVLESPTTAVRGDRFIIRTFSSMKTIGGGVILDAQAKPHKRSEKTDSLSGTDSDSAAAVEHEFLKSGFSPLTLEEVANSIGEDRSETASAVNALLGKEKLVRISEDRYIHSEPYSKLTERLIDIIEEYYKTARFHFYMPASDLMSKFTRMAGRQVYDRISLDLAENGVLIKKGAKIGLANRKIDWGPGEREASEKIEKAYKSAGFAAPLQEEVQNATGTPERLFRELMNGLLDSGILVRLDDKVTYHTESLEKAKTATVEYISNKGSITAAELRDLLGVSRKYAIPLLEYFDSISLTKRVGDQRVLR